MSFTIVFPKTNATDKELEDSLSKASMQVLRLKAAAFISPVLARMEDIVFTRTVPTAKTDGTKIWINPDFWMGLPTDTRLTVLVHEIKHPAALHGLRQNGRDGDLWNQACDHAINLELIEENMSFKGIEWACQDKRFKDMSAEQIYDILLKEEEQSPGRHTASQQAEYAKDLKPAPTFEAAQKQIMNVIAATQHAKKCGNPGAIPGEIELIIDEFLRPKINWRLQLRRYMTEHFNKIRTFSRPNRRYEDIYMPSYQPKGLGRLVAINYYLDISGSISDANILRFNSEVKHIKEEFNPDMLRLITFDTVIHDVYEFDRNTPFNKVVVTGRGGTSLKQVFAHIAKTKPKVSVIFTDMEVQFPQKPPNNNPIIWVVIGTQKRAPYGTHIDIEDE